LVDIGWILHERRELVIGPESNLASTAVDVVEGPASAEWGGLTPALLQALRDAGETPPAGAVLMSPLLDLTASGASIVGRADEDPIFTPTRSAASDRSTSVTPTPGRLAEWRQAARRLPERTHHSEAASATRQITDFIRQLLNSDGRHAGRPKRQRA
jgi:hypothetical protein